MDSFLTALAWIFLIASGLFLIVKILYVYVVTYGLGRTNIIPEIIIILICLTWLIFGGKV